MEFDPPFSASGEAVDREIYRRFRDGERLMGYTKQGIPIVMDEYAFDPVWGTKEEELEKKESIKAEMARILCLPRKKTTSGLYGIGG